MFYRPYKLVQLRSQKERGLTLLVVMLAISMLSLMLAGVMTYSQNSFKNARRLALSVELKQAALSELEVVYNRWVQEMSRSVNYAALPETLAQAGFLTSANNQTLSPFSTIGDASSMSPYRIERRLSYLGGNVEGAASLQRFNASVTVTYNHPSFGEMVNTTSRIYTMEQTPMFNNAIFVQGPLELAAGGNMVIRGTIAVNGDAYAASQHNRTLTIAGLLQVTGNYNGTRVITESGNILRNPAFSNSSDKLKKAVFDRTPGDGQTPVSQDLARAAQLKYVTDPFNFLGGVDIPWVLQEYSNVYKNENDVYRSVIAPPPLQEDGITPIPEDPVVRGNRMYSKASLIIKIDEGGRISITDPSQPGIDIAEREAEAFRGVVTGVRERVFDPREKAEVHMTTLSVSRLEAAMIRTGLDQRYTGVTYIYDTQRGIDKAVIRLIDGQSTPNFKDMGFTVASDNALYVQGDYNTVYLDRVNKLNNRAVLMADAVTAVSSGWNPADARVPVANRLAKTSTGNNSNRTAAKNNNSTIVAAIVAGGTLSKNGVSGGGIHNLVRFVENWSSRSFNIKGSLGQLFESKYFTGVFQNPSAISDVYRQPQNRDIQFDPLLASKPPGQAISSTTYSRGAISD